MSLKQAGRSVNLKPGDTVWFDHDGQARSGVVWDRAPIRDALNFWTPLLPRTLMARTVDPVWVIPDTPLDTDQHSALYVHRVAGDSLYRASSRYGTQSAEATLAASAATARMREGRTARL